MGELHSLLRRQLKRYFPDDRLPAEFEPMLTAIDQAYRQFDNDRAMLERSLELSSQELLQANAELRALVSAFPDHILRLHPGGTILDIKGAPSEQSRRWLPGQDFVETFDASARPPLVDALHRVASQHATANIELEAGDRYYEARLLPLEDAQVLMILRDVTERHFAETRLQISQQALHEAHRDLEKRVEERTAALGRANDELRREMAERQAAESARSQLEEQLRHAQKMEAIGRLSGGIAHDFNNLLTAIRGYSELLLKELHGSPLRADVEEIFNAADRAATLTGQLLAFSRRQILSPEIVVLNQRVTDMSRMLDRLIGEHIAIDLRLASDLWTVRADAAQLEQVLVNLVLNARDAMPQGGRLAIETSNRDIRPTEAATLEIAPGPYVELRVRDNGIGIPLEVQGRIFEPFFTTKPKGAGTGLGLSMVYGFVKQSGGAITVDSAPGHGTAFSLLLPRTDDTTDPAPTPRQLAPLAERGSGTILIAEDERALRRLSATVLGQAGYRTLEATDGLQALDLFTANSRSVILVVTDVVMPRMGGIDLAARLRSTHPHLPILFVTGYVEQSDALHESAGGTPVLLKPFSPEALLRAVSTAVQAAKK
ncbi:MAG TPA: ATP-binding protein [Vicinamibacterales bacterium]|nr:ATP-binding protein [Vicinamibacterales bacterium]